MAKAKWMLSYRGKPSDVLLSKGVNVVLLCWWRMTSWENAYMDTELLFLSMFTYSDPKHCGEDKKNTWSKREEKGGKCSYKKLIVWFCFQDSSQSLLSQLSQKGLATQVQLSNLQQLKPFYRLMSGKGTVKGN